MKVMMYKERGGINWCLCKIIAEYEDKIWLHNLHVGSMPVKRKNTIMLKEAEQYLEDLNNDI
tara:strand:+ start:682 stop:867 length:186 start_codon:yes stop_codon:yes gene_type:complete